MHNTGRLSRETFLNSFEARLVNVKILPSPSILFTGMAGAVLPVVNAHGEGRAFWANPADEELAIPVACYVDETQNPTEIYPLNPNGSRLGRTSFTTTDGRATIIMPHPEKKLAICSAVLEISRFCVMSLHGHASSKTQGFG